MMLRFDAARKWATLLGVTLLAALTLALPARADTLSVFADLPVAMSLKVDDQNGHTDSSSASGLSGAVVGVTLPFFVGFAYENYGSKFSSPNIFGQSFRYDVTMYDLFLNLPLPLVNIAVGGGVGKGKLSDAPTGVSIDDGNLTQLFASLGVPIFPLVDIHVGYHAFSGKNAVSQPAGVQDLKVSGDMWSLGLKIGF